jgi:hypothetical protein
MTTELHIFRTDINTVEKVRKAETLLSRHKGVNRWNLDLDDCDKVLRIESDKLVRENVIGILKSHEIFVEELQ